jgi:hypothetical protein
MEESPRDGELKKKREELARVQERSRRRMRARG